MSNGAGLQTAPILLMHINIGQYTVYFDVEDSELIMRYTWHVHNYKKLYAATYINRKTIFMHSLILPTINKVDHKDGNGLNNSRSNLRNATTRQNSQNRKKQSGTHTSKYKGVSLDNYEVKKGRSKVWVASITTSNGRIKLGLFKTEIKAVEAYNNAAITYFGEFAKINIIEKNNE